MLSTNNRLLQAGSPCSRAGSTTPSWAQTNLLANSQSPRCSRKVPLSSRNRPGRGSPCARAGNTMPSWPQTNLLANSQSPRCSRKVPLSSRNRPGWGSPCHDARNTTPSRAQTNLPANSRSHPRNCTDRGVAEQPLASKLGSPSGEFCNTTPFWPASTLTRDSQRNCKGRLVLALGGAPLAPWEALWEAL